MQKYNVKKYNLNTYFSILLLQLPYSMKLEYDSRGSGYNSGMMALLPPKVNVSSRGFVPTSPQVFSIRLPCSGLESAEIKLALKLNVSSPEPRYDDTVLVFKRNKICMKGKSTNFCRYNLTMDAVLSLW